MEKLPQLTAVEFPGRLRSAKQPQNALQALGGDEALRTAFSSHQPLTLNLRPFPNASPSNIISEDPLTPNNLFLIRITPPKSTAPAAVEQSNQQSDGAVTEKQTNSKPRADLVARVSCLFRFRCLADFQYHPMTDALLATSPSSLTVRRHNAKKVFEYMQTYSSGKIVVDHHHINKLRPRRFCRSQPEYGTTEYWFRQFAMPSLAHTHTRHLLIPGRPLGDDRRSDAKRLSILHHRVSVFVDQVPTSPRLKPPVVRGRQRYEEVHAHVTKLFQIRPIWVRKALLEGLPQHYQPAFKRVIPAIAFSFHGAGPFYQAWIRYGYDPRKDPESRKYQVVDIRTTNPVIIAAAVQKVSSETEQREREQYHDEAISEVYPAPFQMPTDFTLSTVPRKRNNFIQVRDISLKTVLSFLRETPPTKKFDVKYGFFNEANHRHLIKLIKDTLLKMASERLGDEKTKSIRRGDHRRRFLRDYMATKGRNSDASDSDSPTEAHALLNVRKEKELRKTNSASMRLHRGTGVEAATTVADIDEDVIDTRDAEGIRHDMAAVTKNRLDGTGLSRRETPGNAEDAGEEMQDKADNSNEESDDGMMVDDVEEYEILDDDDDNEDEENDETEFS